MKTTATLAAAALASFAGFAVHAQTMTAEGSNPGSSPLTTIMTLAELASAAGIADFQVQDGQTLTDSLVNVARGTTDVAPVPLIAPFLLSRGAGPYASIGAEGGTELVGKVSALFTVSLGAMGLYAYNSSGVSGWDSLEGKRIINGPPSGGALANARAMIQIIAGLEDGKGYEGVQSNWGQMSQFIADGSGDGMVLPIYFPDDRLTQAAAAGAMTLYSVPREAYESEPFQKYLASPGTVGFEIPVSELPRQEGVTIQSEDEIWRGPATAGAVVVNSEMDFDTAKALTALFLDNLETFETKAPYMRYVLLGAIDAEDTGMCGPNPIKYHPGAVAAWEEAGYTVPDCAKP
ncbi:TAXI family TRAP transporter solute-binding subunit [Frigidibacter oleivorans]|uniref:TAXI family TRAP transporter solute-binding subunit n=1 Tax=Frigidibacter oleivorans TaxID=2487129 RepID=UPI000F8E0C7D|nr:TAXI family TRAP transporter solute-binding subunit [Frigidibacter oleivorans]